jgi:hypothetical protein
MESYLIKYNNNIIGVYNDIDIATLFIKSCLSNKLMIGSADILVYIMNSCLYVKTINVILDLTKTEKPINKQVKIEENIILANEIDYNDPKYLKLSEEKIDLQHKINMLKIQRERIEQSKKVYENDIKLYNNFKEQKDNDNLFIIPELFKDKFNIFENLDNQNKLSWDNFIKEYNHDNIYTDYFSSNSYDESFSKKININEEFDIDSGSSSGDE